MLGKKAYIVPFQVNGMSVNIAFGNQYYVTVRVSINHLNFTNVPYVQVQLQNCSAALTLMSTTVDKDTVSFSAIRPTSVTNVTVKGFLLVISND